LKFEGCFFTNRTWKNSWILPKGQTQPQKNLPRRTVRSRSKNVGRAQVTKVREEIALTKPSRGSILRNKPANKGEGKADPIVIRR